jgi:hypothetical protein
VALDAIADEANAPRIRDLSYKLGAGVNDVTISSLGSLVLPALSHPDQANRLFVDHVLLALSGCISLRPMEACGQSLERENRGVSNFGNDVIEHVMASSARKESRSAYRNGPFLRKGDI